MRIQFLSLSVLVSCCIMWKVIILKHILLSINLDYSSRALEHVFFQIVTVLGDENLFSFLNQIWLVQASECHLLVHWDWNFTVFSLNLFFLFWKSLWTALFLWMSLRWMIKMLWNRRHRYRWNSMRSMNHAASNTLLVGVICSLLGWFSIFGLVLEI